MEEGCAIFPETLWDIDGVVVRNDLLILTHAAAVWAAVETGCRDPAWSISGGAAVSDGAGRF